MTKNIKADLEELKTYLNHAKEEMVEGSELEARNYINDALSKIQRMKKES